MTEDRLGLAFYYAGTERCRPGHAWSGVRDHWLFHLVHQGHGLVRMGGMTRRLGAGEGFLVGPGVETFYQADETDPWAYSWLACSGFAAEACFLACGLGPSRPYFRNLIPGFYKVDGEFHGNIGYLNEATGEFAQLAALYLAFAGLRGAAVAPEGEVPPRRPADAYWDAVQDFLRTTYSREDTRIEALAHRIGVSRKHLSEIVRKRCGKSPRALLSQYRLEKACGLLIDSRLTVGSVAASVGFGDPLAFSRAFHQAYGQSPSAWRTHQGWKNVDPQS